MFVLLLTEVLILLLSSVVVFLLLGPCTVILFDVVVVGDGGVDVVGVGVDHLNR